MKDIIETTLLEFDKSAFLIDLVKHENGELYVEIIQTILNDKKGEQSIKINASVLTELISVLQNYQTKLPQKYKFSKKNFSEIDKQKIQESYLKGVSSKDIAIQFNCKIELIEMALRNRGIEIFSNEMPKPKFWRKRK